MANFMQIRPPATFLDADGHPATDFKVYISEPFTDPKDESKRLILTDGPEGPIISNPFSVTKDGYAKNADGQTVSPCIAVLQYAILFETPGGGQQFTDENAIGDGYGVETPAFADMVDRTYNNLDPLVLESDLTDLNLIYVKSHAPGWEGTDDGPIDGAYYYYTGELGPPGTEDGNTFYDSIGNEWTRTSESQRPYDNETRITTNDGLIAANTENITLNTDAIAEINDDQIPRIGELEISRISTIVTHVRTTNANFIPHADTVGLGILVVGAGGGGGGSRSKLQFNPAAAPGGGGGGWARIFLPENDIQGSYTVNVGLKGSGGSGTAEPSTAGGGGGISSVSDGNIIVTATGGDGGGRGWSDDTESFVKGALGGVGTGGDENGHGGDSLGTHHTPGISGASIFGGEVSSVLSRNTGVKIDGTVAGAGGSGGLIIGAHSGDYIPGGDGAAGLVIFYEYRATTV